MRNKKDTIYQNIEGEIKPFEFDERVADVFPDMINRSVPGYAQTLSMMSVIAREYAQANTQIYDLGCSLGVAVIALGQSIEVDGCRIVAVDNSAAMIKRCEKNLARIRLSTPVELIHSDLRNITVSNASIVVLNYTLQFLPVSERERLLKTIFNGMNDKGVLIISEKIRMETEAEQQQMTTLHHQFKRLNGYDDLEIAAKRTALENVLVPETLSTHLQRLRLVGFNSANMIMQNLNFVSLLAQK